MLTSTDKRPLLFVEPRAWADMDSWHAQVGEIRRTEPVFRAEAAGFDPFWVLTRHADVFAVSRDNERWLNTPNSIVTPAAMWQRLQSSGLPPPATLVHLDGERHRSHRQVTNDWFKPAAVSRRQARIDEFADQFVEKMRQLGGECDFATDIAQPFTLRVIMDIYGVPEEDESLMLELTQGVFGSADPEFMGDAENPEMRAAEAAMKFVQYFAEITKDRQACPRDDFASLIANGQVDGCPMGDLERFFYYLIVATAGHDTTSFALAGGMEAMLRDPQQLRLLHDDPGLIVNATEEIIRWTAPVRHFLRYPTETTEIRGVEISVGDRVLLSYPAANRDESVFVDPDRFDVTRPDADKLISFGLGAHFCLGAQFARREIRTMMARLSRELAHIEPAGDAQWAESHFVSGVKHLPMAYSFR